jgi:RHS repeat-associated protein
LGGTMRQKLLRLIICFVLMLLLSNVSISIENCRQSIIDISWIANAFAGGNGKNVGDRPCWDPYGNDGFAADGSQPPKDYFLGDEFADLMDQARRQLGDLFTGSPFQGVFAGNPIEMAVGNKFQIETDFVGGAATGLSLVRYYNSDDSVNLGTNGPGFGTNWITMWHRYVYIPLPLQPGTSYAQTFTPSGRVDEWEYNSSGQWEADPDVRSRFSLLTDSGSNVIGVKIVLADDTVEEYTEKDGTVFHLTKTTTRQGLETTLTYDANHNPTLVTGPFGDKLTFTYDADQHVKQMTAPNGDLYTYEYLYSYVLARGILSSVTYPDGSKRQYVYENTTLPRALTGIIDEKGNRFATWMYSTSFFQGHALSSEHAGGVEKTTLAYSYASNGLPVTKVTDARGNEQTYTFKNQFNLIKIADISGTSCKTCSGRTFTYDSNGFIASRTDWNNNVTTYTHDARGNETSHTEAYGTPLARTITTTWHSTYNLPTKIVEPNRTTNFTYDAKGNLLSKKITASGLTRIVSYTYNSFGQVLTETDPLGKKTSYAYDADGNLASLTNALGHVTQYTSYDLNGRLLTFVDPNGVTTALTYDDRGRLTSKTEGALKTSLEYDLTGNLTKLTLPDNSFLEFTYDAAHRLIGIEDALGNRIAYTLDKTSNVTKVQAFDSANVQKYVHSYAYDTSNRLIRSIAAQGRSTSFTYDPQSNLKAITDPLSHKTTYVYDALNRRIRITDANNSPISLKYDTLNHLISVTDPRKLKTSYTWTGFDDEKEITSPDTGKTTRTFDAGGNVLTETDSRGKTTTYMYDALNRMIKETFADGTSVIRQYDSGTYGKGRLTRITDATGRTDYSYDANGHVTRKLQVISGLTRTTLYAYDTGGRLSSITYPSGKKVVYTYDAAGNVVSLKLNNQSVISGTTYAPFSGVTSWKFGNGATYNRTFNLNNRISALALPAGNNISLTYDNGGRITKMTDNKIPAKTFGYDALDRLTSYTGGTKTQSYGYDVDSNRTSASLKDGSTTNSFTYTFPATSNRLSGISGAWNEAFTYAADGSTASHTTPSGKYTFSYDARGRLVKAKYGALSRTYGINGRGQRAVKKDTTQPTNNRYFVYDLAGRLIGEYGQSGSLVQETVWLGDLPIATLQSTGNFYIAPDYLGAPHQITNANRQVVWQWDHDPFGNGTPTGSLTYNLRFPGQYYDSETGLNYNYFRDYDPKLGRYTQSDPIGLAAGINTYVFVRGNPVCCSDRLGLLTLTGGLTSNNYIDANGNVQPLMEAMPKVNGQESPYPSDPKKGFMGARPRDPNVKGETGACYDYALNKPNCKYGWPFHFYSPSGFTAGGTPVYSWVNGTPGMGSGGNVGTGDVVIYSTEPYMRGIKLIK